jgi:hypothetical protein
MYFYTPTTDTISPTKIKIQSFYAVPLSCLNKLTAPESVMKIMMIAIIISIIMAVLVEHTVAPEREQNGNVKLYLYYKFAYP